MKTSICRSYDELPLFLNASLVSQVLGVSVSTTYELMLVVANSISFALPHAAGLTHSVAPPLPTQALCACAGATFRFPVLRVGSRMVVPKEKFAQWVEGQSGGAV